MNFANQVKNTLLQDIANMANVSWFFSKHPETDFTRKRKIDFQSLLHFSICMEAGTLRHELLKYFSYDPSTLSNSAFYQQRRKLLPETYFPPDGKTTNGYNQVHLVALFDLLSRRFTDCTVQPIRKKNEFLALTQMIDRCDLPDAVPIFIADRGFHSFNVFAHAIEHNAYFLIRAKDVNMRRLLGQDIPEENCFDVWIDRILRFKISDDIYENIITNLPDASFSTAEIKSLYGLRWGIMRIST